MQRIVDGSCIEWKLNNINVLFDPNSTFLIGNACYRIIAIVQHFGPHSQNGHYVANIKIEDKWMKFNHLQAPSYVNDLGKLSGKEVYVIHLRKLDEHIPFGESFSGVGSSSGAGSSSRVGSSSGAGTSSGAGSSSGVGSSSDVVSSYGSTRTSDVLMSVDGCKTFSVQPTSIPGFPAKYTKYDIMLYDRDLLTLRPKTLLNDNIINYFCCILQKWNNQVTGKRMWSMSQRNRPHHIFSTLFMMKLESEKGCYTSVER